MTPLLAGGLSLVWTHRVLVKLSSFHKFIGNVPLLEGV